VKGQRASRDEHWKISPLRQPLEQGVRHVSRLSRGTRAGEKKISEQVSKNFRKRTLGKDLRPPVPRDRADASAPSKDMKTARKEVNAGFTVGKRR